MVNLSISAYDLFVGSPKYVKFFKTILANKDGAMGDDVILISAKYSSLLKKDLVLPQKLRDPESCIISCEFKGKATYKALCDSGSGVSLMPKAIAQSLNIISEMKDTRTTLQLADRSIVKPRGVIKDASVGIDKFVLPYNFIIIEEKIGSQTLMILGRPFLATGDA